MLFRLLARRDRKALWCGRSRGAAILQLLLLLLLQQLPLLQFLEQLLRTSHDLSVGQLLRLLLLTFCDRLIGRDIPFRLLIQCSEVIRTDFIGDVRFRLRGTLRLICIGLLNWRDARAA